MNRFLGRRVCLSQTRPLRDFSTAPMLNTKPSCSQSTPSKPTTHDGSPLALSFWSSRPTWRRASLNTLRCLIGCTSGDFAALWILQSHYPGLGMGVIMGVSSKAPTVKTDIPMLRAKCRPAS
jgi:hypothetical protein